MRQPGVPPEEIFPGVVDRGEKRFFDGTHRVTPPEETLARLEPLAAAMGITRVANVTGLDIIGIPVVMVTRPQARSLSVSQGKGASLAAAKASGLMEAIELYHAERAPGPLLLDSYNSLRARGHVVDVERLMPHEAGQFHPDLSILWIQGFDIMRQEWVYLPHESVHTDFTNRMRAMGGCFYGSSNGLASGNHMLEAILHGICEVVERDAHWHWIAVDRELDSRDRIHPDSISDPGCQRLLSLCRQADMRVGLWDMTADYGVAAIYCAIAGPVGTKSRRLYASAGAGCHPVREIALQRALTEAAQSRLTMIAGSRDDVPRARYEETGKPDVVDFYVTLLGDSEFGRDFREVPSHHSDSVYDDLRWLLSRLSRKGLDSIIVVNLTQPRFDVPVVRVIIPDTRVKLD